MVKSEVESRVEMPAAEGMVPSSGSHPALGALLARGTPGADAVDAFLDKHAFPLVEPGAATFVFRGMADAVSLLSFIHGGVDRRSFLPVPGTDLWLLRLSVEDAGRFEYKLAISRNGHEDWIVDPLNPVRAGDPFGENSVCRTFGYARPDWSEAHGAPPGRIDEMAVTSGAFGETRIERIYLPAGHDTARAYPVVVIHDGADFLSYAGLSVVLDNLIASGDIPPVVAALVQTRNRTTEYADGRLHARYIVHDLLPALGTRCRVSHDPRGRVLLGASLGAVASLATAFRYPGVFGGLVLMSGSFIFDGKKLAQRTHPVFHQVAELIKTMQRAPPLPNTRAFVSTGELEGLAPENHALADFLRAGGVDVLFKSAWDGHHWHNWRDQLRDGLIWVLRSEADRHG
jgi:enterochelin esterase-like enzyme